MYNLDLQVAQRLQSCGTPVYRREETRGGKRAKRPMEERWRMRNKRNHAGQEKDDSKRDKNDVGLRLRALSKCVFHGRVQKNLIYRPSVE